MKYRSLVIVIVLVGVAAMAVRPAFDSDTFWHLRAGAWILENGRVPTVDVFSHTAPGAPWRYPGWLAEVALVGAYRTGGLSGLTVFAAITVMVGLAFVWLLLEGHILVRAATLLLAAATSAVYWAARPHLVTFALSSFFLWVLERRRRGRKDWVFWLLPVAMAVWVNVHGGFAIGFLLILMYLAADGIDFLAAVVRARGTWGELWNLRKNELARLAGVLVASLAAAGLNPHGPAILAYPWQTVAIPVLQQHIQEWQSPDFHQPGLYPFLAMLIALLVAFGTSRRAGTASELVLTAAWSILALLAVRNVAIFALVVAPVLCRHSGTILEPLLGNDVEESRKDPRRRRIHALAAGVMVIAGVAWASVQFAPQRNLARLKEIAPVDAVAAMHALELKGPVFNDYNWGSYLLWAAYPQYPTFVDGRTDVFPGRVFEDYVVLWSAQRNWQGLLQEYGIRLVLLPPEAPLVRALEDRGWPVRYRDNAAVVLERPDP